MKKYLQLALCSFLYTFQFSYAGSFKKHFKKLPNKKIANNAECYENTNLFTCISRCEKESSCKIFNYNSQMKICQLTDQEVDDDYKDSIASKGWEVYIPVTQMTKNDQRKEDRIEVIEFKKESESAEKMDLYINTTNLSICFWIMPRYGRAFTLVNNKNHTVFGMFFDTDGGGTDYITLILSGTAENYFFLHFEMNEYYHICYVFSNSSANLYIDGQSNWGFNASTQRIHAMSLMIGFSPNAPRFTGFLFDFNVFTKHLTQPQVQMVMKGKNNITRKVTWEDVKQRFKNVSNIDFRKTIIPKISQVTDD